LQEARAGVYPLSKFDDTKLAILEKYFVAEASGGFKIRPFVRKMVRFTLDDVTSRDRFAPADSVFGSFDLVLCRNLLIYFSTELREHVLQKLYKALAEGGYLILGDSESLDRGMSSKFITVDDKNRIFRKA
jgi:chemotaxis methyl-accepting protein methylase